MWIFLICLNCSSLSKLDYLKVFFKMVFSITSLTVVYCVLTRHTKVLTHTRDTSFFIKGCREEDGWVEKGVELGRWDINIWIINSPDRPPKFSLPLCLWWESVQSSQRWNNGGEGSTGAAMSHPHTRTLANSVNMQTHSHMLSTLIIQRQRDIRRVVFKKVIFTVVLHGFSF